MKIKTVGKKNMVVEVKSMRVAKHHTRMLNTEIEETLEGLKILKDWRIKEVLTVNTVTGICTIEMVRRKRR